eukprot:2707205-Pyramimonas_sp.AAC.1
MAHEAPETAPRGGPSADGRHEWVLFQALGPKRPPGGPQAVAVASAAVLAQVVRGVFLTRMQQRCTMMMLFPHVALPGAW